MADTGTISDIIGKYGSDTWIEWPNEGPFHYNSDRHCWERENGLSVIFGPADLARKDCRVYVKPETTMDFVSAINAVATGASVSPIADRTCIYYMRGGKLQCEIRAPGVSVVANMSNLVSHVNGQWVAVQQKETKPAALMLFADAMAVKGRVVANDRHPRYSVYVGDSGAVYSWPSDRPGVEYTGGFTASELACSTKWHITGEEPPSWAVARDRAAAR